MALIAVVTIPVLAASLCWIRPFRAYPLGITFASTWSVLALVVFISAGVITTGRVVGLPGWLECDGLSALVLLLVSLVCAVACVFAGGYMRRAEHESGPRWWWFYSNYNLLVFALLAVPALAEPNLAWVSIGTRSLSSKLPRSAPPSNACW